MLPKPSPCVTRRAVTLVGLTALFATPWSCFAADAAPATQGATSIAGKPKTLHLVFINEELRAPGLTTPERDETLVDYKYYEITRYFKERAPLVFEANGLVGDATVVEPPAQDTPLVLDFPIDDPVITLAPVSFGKQRKLLQVWAGVTFAVTPFERQPAGPPTGKIVKHQLGIRLGPDPVLGILRINRMDASLVDWMLTQALDIAASQGLLTLPQAKAVKPKA
jgi:hypothetical protein